MQELYKLALAEGEGLGTAYEYFVKIRLLNRLLKCKKIENILIYGLPERYGFSLDFIYFCYKNNLDVFLFEKRKDKIKKFKEILGKLNKKNIINGNLKIIKKIDKRYDLVLSCEVLQALKENELKEYISNIQKHSKTAIVFVPNKSNKSHVKFSGLNGFTLEELKKIFKNNIMSGYIDIPPFPPGLKKKKKIKNNLIIRIISLFAYIEKFYPRIIKRKFGHVCYVYLINF